MIRVLKRTGRAQVRQRREHVDFFSPTFSERRASSKSVGVGWLRLVVVGRGRN